MLKRFLNHSKVSAPQLRPSSFASGSIKINEITNRRIQSNYLMTYTNGIPSSNSSTWVNPVAQPLEPSPCASRTRNKPSQLSLKYSCAYSKCWKVVWPHFPCKCRCAQNPNVSKTWEYPTTTSNPMPWSYLPSANPDYEGGLHLE